jgi:hypothetical protein
MSYHTQGRLIVRGTRIFDTQPGIDCMASMQVSNQPNWEQDARRLVACWNACEGIDTYALELMTGNLSIYNQITTTSHPKAKPETRTAVKYRHQRDELLAALVAITEDKTPWGNAAAAKTQIALKAIAIAKATGGAA